MSVVDRLYRDAAADECMARELREDIAVMEKKLDDVRLRLADTEIRIVESKIAANILQDRNLRVEHRPDGIHVEVDALPETAP